MKLFSYLFTVIISSLILMAVCSKLANRGLKKSSVDFFGKMNAAGNPSLKVEIIMAGSSRMLVQVDPAIIDSATGLSSYNYGLNLVGIKTCYNLINYAITAHPESKAVLLNIDYSMFNIDKDPYKDPFFYAFENKSPNFFIMSDPKLNFFHRLHIFDITMYDDMAKYAAINGLVNPDRILNDSYKGYVPNVTDKGFEVPPPSFLKNKTTNIFTKRDLGILQDIISLCNKSGKKIVLVIAPYVTRYAPQLHLNNYGILYDKIKQIAANNSVPLLDYSDCAISQNDSAFYDFLHLNVKGAKLYSTMLAADLRKITDSLK